jgi:Flp pilus assembly protein TadG
MRTRQESGGQAAVLTVMFMAGLLGMAALVLDVGSWFRDQRASQSAADAAALAGAQELPASTGNATAAALNWSQKNDGGLAGADITFSSQITPNDTISVRVKRTSPSFFSKIFGLTSANVSATATARVDGIAAARYVAPITVPISQSQLGGSSCPCFKQMTTLDLGAAGAPGAFHLINLDGSFGGTGQTILADWILNGYDQELPLGGYFSDAGAKWNSSEVQNALSTRIGSDLLFPVYDSIAGTGSNAQYHVIGWVGFYLTGIDARGSSGELYGYFDQVIWEGLQATTPGGGGPDLGAKTIQLVN